jgi:hypothetical protein
MRLKTLSYSSRARIDLSDDDLNDIHQTARHLNALDGITGLLVFDGSRFLQIVEGDEGAIDDLLDRLRSDRRHSSIEVRDARFVSRRSFSDWSMELVRVGAGFRDARAQIGTRLPENVLPEVRDLALRMADELES